MLCVCAFVDSAVYMSGSVFLSSLDNVLSVAFETTCEFVYFVDNAAYVQ